MAGKGKKGKIKARQRAEQGKGRAEQHWVRKKKVEGMERSNRTT